MPWGTAFELLLAGGLMGAAGAVVRLVHPDCNRLCKCALWELPSAALIGMAGYALAAEIFAFGDYGRFLMAFCAGYLGHAAIHDLVLSVLKARVRLSDSDAEELTRRRRQDNDRPGP